MKGKKYSRAAGDRFCCELERFSLFVPSTLLNPWTTKVFSTTRTTKVETQCLNVPEVETLCLKQNFFIQNQFPPCPPALQIVQMTVFSRVECSAHAGFLHTEHFNLVCFFLVMQMAHLCPSLLLVYGCAYITSFDSSLSAAFSTMSMGISSPLIDILIENLAKD